ncbi:hypothetical protein ANCCAN_10514 [Ancylostoma caninum]|uniref:Peptidase A2 domain-containing protein n=1 Tax=Ancylostoma caninum TaxID=29170 RepID=A0A368GGJ0_ANCCA|nr:hypothetical protein ANCCAN_10514 [Ancylostoma caninum]
MPVGSRKLVPNTHNRDTNTLTWGPGRFTSQRDVNLFSNHMDPQRSAAPPQVQAPEEPMEVGITCNPWCQALKQVVRECDSALTAQLRHLSAIKRQRILAAVQNAVDCVQKVFEDERKNDQEAREIVQALATSAERLSEILPDVLNDAAQMRVLTKKLGCNANELERRLEEKEEEIAVLKAKLESFQAGISHQPERGSAEDTQGSPEEPDHCRGEEVRWKVLADGIPERTGSQVSKICVDSREQFTGGNPKWQFRWYLRKARRTPCERLRAQVDWTNLRKLETESVFDFCCRLRAIAKRKSPDSDCDFEMGSKLYECLSEWKDSYYMLAALDSPKGTVFDEVRKVALRLERTQEPSTSTAVQPKTWKQRYGKGKVEQKQEQSTPVPPQSPPRKPKGDNPRQRGTPQQQRGPPRNPRKKDQPKSVEKAASKPKAIKESSTRSKQTRNTFSTHLKSWCCKIKRVRSPKPDSAYGGPCLCNIEIFGMKAKALIDTGSVITIIPLGLLKKAMKRGADLDKMVTMMGSGSATQVYDASGNLMSFLMLIAATISVEGAGSARVQMHIQKSENDTILLGTNALESLGIRIQLGSSAKEEQQPKRDSSESLASAAHKVIIPPFSAAKVVLTGPTDPTRQVFLSSDDRIASAVCQVSDGHATVSVVNRESKAWKIPKGQPLGTWTQDRWYDPKTADIPGDMLEIKRAALPSEEEKLNILLDILKQNWQSGDFPKELEGKWLDELREDKNFEPVIDAVENGRDVECARAGPLSEVVPDPPIPELVLETPFQLGRAVTILQATHLPEHVKRDLLLDTSYITMSAIGLAVAYAYLRKKCMHIGNHLRKAIHAQVEPHPHRHTEEPYNLEALVTKACRCQSILADWSTAEWSRLEVKKVVVLLPEGFEPYVGGFTHIHQVAYAYVGPADFRREWFDGEISAIVFFTPSRSATPDDWYHGLWRWMLSCVADGADLFCLPGPRDEETWGFGIDFVRDFCDEIRIQRPSLIPRIHELLPFGDEREADAPFNNAAPRYMANNLRYLESAVRRFLNTSLRYYRAHIVLLRYHRTPPPRERQERGDGPPDHGNAPHAAIAPQEPGGLAPRRQERAADAPGHQNGADRAPGRQPRGPAPRQQGQPAPSRRRSSRDRPRPRGRSRDRWDPSPRFHGNCERTPPRGRHADMEAQQRGRRASPQRGRGASPQRGYRASPPRDRHLRHAEDHLRGTTIRTRETNTTKRGTAPVVRGGCLRFLGESRVGTTATEEFARFRGRGDRIRLSEDSLTEPSYLRWLLCCLIRLCTYSVLYSFDHCLKVLAACLAACETPLPF